VKQTTGNTGAFVNKEQYGKKAHPRLAGKGKSPLSESMKAELAKRKAPAKKPTAQPARKKPSLMEQAKTVAKGVASDVKAIVPRKNAEVTRIKKEQVERHVEGRKPKK
jgi:hypothetical protein